jgi:hypothetical protein
MVAKAAPLPDTSFLDRHGRRWDLRFTPEAVKDAKVVFGVDLARACRDPERLAEVIVNPFVRVIQLAALVVADQLAERALSPEDFGRLLTEPDTWERAGKALLFAISDHFPESPAGVALGLLRTDTPTRWLTEGL